MPTRIIGLSPKSLAPYPLFVPAAAPEPLHLSILPSFNLFYLLNSKSDMQIRYIFIVLLIGALLPLTAQEGIIGADFANGWNNGDGIAFSPSLGGSLIGVRQAAGNGNRFFRLYTGSDQLGPFGCVDADWNAGDGFSYNDMPVCSNGAFFVNVTDAATDNYVFKSRSATDNDFIYFRIQGPIAEILLTQQMPSANEDGEVPSDMDINVASLVDIDVPVGQGFYLRYTTDGFTTSTVIPMTVLCVSGICTAFSAIPGQPDGTTVDYYVFSSGDVVAPAADGSDADYRTINADTNFGANFSYTTNNVLPVTYTSFTGQRQKADVVDLTWATATEDQASHFVVECSADAGRTWMERATVSAQNSHNGATYAFTDNDAPIVDLSYRLRQTDVDGSYQFSNIIPVPALNAAVRIWPQPAAGDRVNLSIPDQYLGGEATLMNTVGRKLSTFSLSTAQQQFNVAGLPAGMYLLQLSAPGGEKTVRRVLVR